MTLAPSTQLTMLPPAPVMGFESFWQLCPKKVDKLDAKKAFDAAIRARKVTLTELCEGMARYAAIRAGKDPQFTKGPAAWIRAGKWMDEAQAHEGGSYRDVLDEIR